MPRGKTTFAEMASKMRISRYASENKRQEPSACFALVTTRDDDEQRPGSRTKCIHVHKPNCYCGLAEAVGGSQHQAKGYAVPVRDVDVELLHQSGRA